MPVRKLTSEQRLSRAIDIMEALYAAGESGMTRTEICSRFDITGVSLDEILEIVSTLADRESGARIICKCRGERVVLTGDAGRVLPLRLSAAEGAVLNHELESLGIDPQAAARIRHALLPEELGYNQRVFDTVNHGSHWQQLSCAIQDGVRCRISYRSMDDARPRERLVDPLRITANGDQTYLIAWDIAVDEQRTYRMDKIEGLALTEDSVVPHAPDVASLHDSLARTQRAEPSASWMTPPCQSVCAIWQNPSPVRFSGTARGVRATAVDSARFVPTRCADRNSWAATLRISCRSPSSPGAGRPR